MSLRGKKPTAIEKRLKALFYGQAGSGKSTAAIKFPKPYIIDTEKGIEQDQYIKLIDDQGGAVFQTSDFNEIIQEITTLLTTKHDYKTLVIDPLTTVYNDLVDQAEKEVGNEFGRHYLGANKKISHLLNLLSRLDMNVIITSHSKNEYIKSGREMILSGQTFDCYKKLDYLFDLVFEIQKRGKYRYAVVKKTRIEGFPDGDQFQFSYEEISKRYGKNILEKNSKEEVLSTPEQITEINRLIELLNVPQETLQKWLVKSNSETISEMTTDQIQKCIDHLQSKIKGE